MVNVKATRSSLSSVVLSITTATNIIKRVKGSSDRSQLTKMWTQKEMQLQVDQMDSMDGKSLENHLKPHTSNSKVKVQYVSF